MGGEAWWTSFFYRHKDRSLWFRYSLQVKSYLHLLSVAWWWSFFFVLFFIFFENGEVYTIKRVSRFRCNKSQITNLKRISIQLFTEFQSAFKKDITEIKWIFRAIFFFRSVIWLLLHLNLRFSFCSVREFISHFLVHYGLNEPIESMNKKA